jgi:hypothetical protein
MLLCAGGSGVLTEAAKLTFDFDRVYKGAGIGRQLFAELTEPVLRQFLNGFNATVPPTLPQHLPSDTIFFSIFSYTILLFSPLKVSSKATWGFAYEGNIIIDLCLRSSYEKIRQILD